MESSSVFFFVGVFALLIGAAMFFPENSLTGNVVLETCEDGSCFALCDAGDNTCGEGTVCCYTHWESGVCGYPEQCDSIREASLYNSLEVYQDSVRTAPEAVNAHALILPLLMCAGIIGYYILRRNDPLWK